MVYYTTIVVSIRDEIGSFLEKKFQRVFLKNSFGFLLLELGKASKKVIIITFGGLEKTKFF